MSQKTKTAREIHGKAEQAREKGEFLTALTLIDEAMYWYQQENDWFGFCDAISSKVITLRHLYDKTGQKEYLILAKYHAMAAVDIAQSKANPSITIMPYTSLGRVQDTLGDYARAAVSFENAVNAMLAYPPKEHNRPSVLSDLKVHMEVCKYKAGDKSAKERAEAALAAIGGSDEVQYNKDVWVSGGHMKLAEALKVDDIEAAKQHLAEAKKVIDSNSDLKIRSEQWEKLAKTFE